VKLDRRAALAGTAALAVSPKAFAQDYPSKPIKIVVPFAAGSATDLAARGLGARLQEILKQPIVIDDKPGASGQLGASAVATAPGGSRARGAGLLLQWLPRQRVRGM